MIEGYTHIHLLLDRSGSMASIREDIVGGVNVFLKGQREAQGKASLTMVQFDTLDAYEVLCHMKDVREVQGLEGYEPRGGTPLFDALGRSINDLEKTIRDLDSARPERIVMVVVTDGEENSSSEFRHSEIKETIRRKQEEGWQFVFLSADLDATYEAESLNFAHAQTMAYAASSEGVSNAFAATSLNVANFRNAPSVASARTTLTFSKGQREEALADGGEDEGS